MYCNNCGDAISENAKFCTNCGTKASQSTLETVPPAARRGEGEAMKVQRFDIASHRFDDVLEDFKIWIQGKNYALQQFPLEDKTILCQIMKSGGWRKLVGMSVALNVMFCPQENSLIVKIGAGKWLDKAISGSVGMVIFWPLFVTTGIGAIEQMKMPGQIFDFIRIYSKN